MKKKIMTYYVLWSLNYDEISYSDIIGVYTNLDDAINEACDIGEAFHDCQAGPFDREDASDEMRRTLKSPFNAPNPLLIKVMKN